MADPLHDIEMAGAYQTEAALNLGGLCLALSRFYSFLLVQFYQVREPIARNWATVGAWEFMPPSTVIIWPLTYALSSEPK